MAVLLETTLGDIVIDLYTEERPKASLNFLKLCKIKYYNYCLVHNVQRDFIIQTGDPTGTGRGGESVFCKLYGDQAHVFEPEKMPRIKHRKKGTVSMVNNGSDQHGSQFLITTAENLDYLDGVHTVFGEVSEGMDVLAKINETFVDSDFIPYQDISGRIGADEVINDEEGRDAEELDEQIKDKEAKTQAILLEMVGDLPDADIKPPENVLFVCKLNPVTTDEDLEIIFSRFGAIKCCEIIRDWKTEESLCYAFIEFEKVEDCEKAYFKMDNVLIDDRRIHVDFSQSVSKIKWKGKGGKYTKEDFKAYEKDLDNKSKLALKDNVKSKQEYPSDNLFTFKSYLDNWTSLCKKDKGRQRSRSRERERHKERERGWDKGREKEKQRDRGRERDGEHKRYRRDRSRSRSPKRSKYYS
uniref:Peptidyl-prolyl cis-trans isomerase n=1 Tax=Sinocyclocheilus grahami TaxID=75366 RepID=A0A672RM97_SINGR